jgi:hypothetical protein
MWGAENATARTAQLIFAVALDHARKSGAGDLARDRPLRAAGRRAIRCPVTAEDGLP